MLIKLSELNLLEKRGKKTESTSNCSDRAYKSYNRTMMETCQSRNNTCAREHSQTHIKYCSKTIKLKKN